MVPSALSAHVWAPPALTWETPAIPAGTVVWPSVLVPQQTTVPSLLSAQLWLQPALICVTPVSPAGTVALPSVLSPQQTTAPSAWRRQLWRPPALTWVTRPVTDWLAVDRLGRGARAASGRVGSPQAASARAVTAASATKERRVIGVLLIPASWECEVIVRAVGRRACAGLPTSAHPDAAHSC